MTGCSVNLFPICGCCAHTNTVATQKAPADRCSLCLTPTTRGVEQPVMLRLLTERVDVFLARAMVRP